MFAENPALLEIIRGAEPKSYAPGGKLGRLAWEVFHMNTVEVLNPGAASPKSELFRAGNVLFCSRYLDLIGVIDMDIERVVWHWGVGELEGPHGPTLLDNGHILVFDNGTRRGRSRIVEMDPGSGQIVATIGDDKRTAFFTAANGGAQRLPNGNTLIVESQRGRVFEVAPGGAVVWEFYSFPFEDGKWKPRRR